MHVHAATVTFWAPKALRVCELSPGKTKIAERGIVGAIAFGAGEGAIRPVAAAIGNAIFDAIGVRLRGAPPLPRNGRAGARIDLSGAIAFHTQAGVSLHVVPEPAMSANIPCVEEDYSGSIRGRSDINRHHAPCREESDTCFGCWRLRQALASLR